MKVNFNNKTVGGFNYELLRGVSLQNADAAEFGECMETMVKIKDNDFDSWTREWSQTADYVADYAQRQLKNGDNLSAKKAFLRASNYYRMACFYAAHTDPRHRGLWEKSKESFYSMIELSEYPIERIDIKFENAILPGYYIPSKQENRPTLIAIGGFDSTMEEVYCWIGIAARNYGWNCLIFEGPGQWGALMNNPGLVFRPDYEKPAGAAVDYLMTRNDIDREKIAIIGYSMGGYLCVRGALDPRIKACIPNTLVVDCGASAKAGMRGMVKYEALMDKTFNLIMKVNTPGRWGFQHSSWTLGISTAHEWVAAYDKFTLLGFEEQLKGKPILFMFSEDDIMDAAAPSKSIVVGLLDYIRSLDCPRYVRLFTKQEGSSSHCQMGGLSYAQASIFAWLEYALCGKTLKTQNTSQAPDLFVGLFGKYGGDGGAKKAKGLLSEITFI
ncbi:MAG: hypothetical protein LBS62_12235 [Clostridiales bacterium]|jgi:pimeloyl-ACP methyl ester carboxylesterase|nr:hypothetical protein [Clostridiales bacterium]